MGLNRAGAEAEEIEGELQSHGLSLSNSKHDLANALLSRAREADARARSESEGSERAQAREDALKRECERSNQRIASIRARALAAEDDAAAASSKAQQEIDDALKSRDHALARVDCEGARAAELERQIDYARGEHRSFPGRVDASHALDEWYGSRVVPLKSRVDATKSLEGKLEALQREVSSEKSERKRLESTISDKEERLERREAEVFSLSSQLKSEEALELERRAEAAEAELEEEKAKCERLSEQLSEMPSRNEQLHRSRRRVRVSRASFRRWKHERRKPSASSMMPSAVNSTSSICIARAYNLSSSSSSNNNKKTSNVRKKTKRSSSTVLQGK
jgi:chromosome segregation ATPase